MDLLSAYLNIGIGLWWVVLAVLIAVVVPWRWYGRMSIIVLGVLLGLYRIEHTVWTAMKGSEETFLDTEAALINNFFTFLAMLLVSYFLMIGQARIDRTRNS